MGDMPRRPTPTISYPRSNKPSAIPPMPSFADNPCVSRNRRLIQPAATTIAISINGISKDKDSDSSEHKSGAKNEAKVGSSWLEHVRGRLQPGEVNLALEST
jgi:hypothetical protein